ncbi:hypothetical protein DPMN_042998 [Dreissena polymorpha]|uniref:Uncharacterized protein n=1 Tax=Dreissena polymorpha TaxID=45954 RepID=A0A9D4HV77_DREPO|nr:hypothetical protein DPMN_042998 [Dreissena polymorpha]
MTSEPGPPPFLRGCKVSKFDKEAVKHFQEEYTCRRHATTIVDTLLLSSYDVLYFTPNNIFLIENAGDVLDTFRFKEKEGDRLPHVYFARKHDSGTQLFCTRCPSSCTFADVDRFIDSTSINVIVCNDLEAHIQEIQNNILDLEPCSQGAQRYIVVCNDLEACNQETKQNSVGFETCNQEEYHNDIFCNNLEACNQEEQHSDNGIGYNNNAARSQEIQRSVNVCNDLEERRQEAQHDGIVVHDIKACSQQAQLDVRQCSGNIQTSRQMICLQVHQVNRSEYDIPMFTPLESNIRETTASVQIEDSHNRDERQQAGADEASFDAMTEIYHTFDSRKETFASSPLRHMEEELAEAGFWYTGMGDTVECYACAGQLTDWAFGSDPWKRHCLRYPNCPFANEKKGEQFIMMMIDDEQVMSGAQANCDSENLTKEVTRRIVGKYVELLTNDMGYNMQEVTDAVKDLVEQGMST